MEDENLIEEKEKKPKFCINDHVDLVVEILQKLDGRSLSVAACVCRQWRNVSRNDWLWENLCFRNVFPPSENVRAVVAALGGYKRLYMVCVKPVLNRLQGGGGGGGGGWSRREVELSLSLFCVDYYERVLLSSGTLGIESSSRSLMFLCKCKPLNV